MEKSTHRKRDIISTQEKIIDAARCEFSTIGIDASRIDGIAIRAGVSKQLVYHYFGSKEELYQVVLDRISEKYFSAFRSIDYDDEPLSVLRAFTEMFFHTQKRWAGVVVIDTSLHDGATIGNKAMAPRITDELMPKIEAVIARGRRNGTLDPDTDARKFFAIANIIITGTIVMPKIFPKTAVGNYPADSESDYWCAFATEAILRSVIRIVPPEGRVWPSRPPEKSDA